LEECLRLALKIEQKTKRGALSPNLELPLSHPTNALFHKRLTKNIAGLGEFSNRAVGSSKGGAQWDYLK